MTKRYFKATDGERTFFRASDSRVYLSLTVDPTIHNGWSMHWDARGLHPAVEITGPEFRKLNETKKRRIGPYDARYTSAGDSWVYNDNSLNRHHRFVAHHYRNPKHEGGGDFWVVIDHSISTGLSGEIGRYQTEAEAEKAAAHAERVEEDRAAGSELPHLTALFPKVF